MSFVTFMSSTAGRAIRVIAGAAIIAAGIASGGTSGVIIAVIGVVPLAAGAGNVCLFAPLFGADFAGRQRTPH
jgi:general stress protein CsbA